MTIISVYDAATLREKQQYAIVGLLERVIFDDENDISTGELAEQIMETVEGIASYDAFLSNSEAAETKPRIRVPAGSH